VNLTEREGVLLAAGGRFLAEMRIVPFTSILESSVDKLRASLASAGPELLGQLETLRFIGVPALAAAPEVLESSSPGPQRHLLLRCARPNDSCRRPGDEGARRRIARRAAHAFRRSLRQMRGVRALEEPSALGQRAHALSRTF
jgi:hypothetical protein